MLETIVITAARDRVDGAVLGALANDPVLGDDSGGGTPEPRFAPFRHRLGQALRRFSDLLDPRPSISTTS